MNGRLKRIDLASVNDVFYFNAANIGLGVKITHQLTAETKKGWGVFSYLKALLEALARRDGAFRARLWVDGRAYRMRSMQIAVGNGRYYGGGNEISARATLSDGCLRCYSLKPQSVGSLFLMVPRLRSGTVQNSPHAFCEGGSEIYISARPAQEVQADGEPAARTPAVFRVVPGALSAVVPE